MEGSPHAPPAASGVPPPVVQPVSTPATPAAPASSVAAPVAPPPAPTAAAVAPPPAPTAAAASPVAPPPPSTAAPPLRASVDPEQELLKQMRAAASDGEHDLLKQLIAGKHENFLSQQDDTGQTLLHLAAKRGHLQCVKLLLNANMGVNAKNLQRLSPLHQAAHHGHLEVVKELLRVGHPINDGDYDRWTALHHAAHGGHADVCRLLLEKNARQLHSFYKWTPLHLAAQRRHVDAMAVLIEFGAQLDGFPKGISQPMDPWKSVREPSLEAIYDQVDAHQLPSFQFSQLGMSLGQTLLDPTDPVSAMCDVTLVPSEGAGMHCHKCILLARSPTLLQRLNQTDGTIRVPELTRAQLAIILKYIYTGTLDLPFLNQGQMPVSGEGNVRDTLSALQAAAGPLGLGDLRVNIMRSAVQALVNSTPLKKKRSGSKWSYVSLEMLASLLPYVDVFEARFSDIIRYYVLQNFKSLLEETAGLTVEQRTHLTLQACRALPEISVVAPVDPPVWRHTNVTPMPEAAHSVCTAVLSSIQEESFSEPFMWPVSAINYEHPDDDTPTVVDYWATIHSPMSLSIVNDRLEDRYYVHPEECISDLRLVFVNAMRYNNETSPIGKQALALFYLTNKNYREQSQARLAPLLGNLPEPLHVGNLSSWIDTEPHMAAIQHTFQAPPPVVTAVFDHYSPKPSRPSSSKRKKKQKKRKASKGTVPPIDYVAPASSKKAKVGPVSQADKEKLGELLPELEEDHIMHVISMIKSRSAKAVEEDDDEDEVELDFDLMSDELLSAIVTYVKSIPGVW